MRVQHALHLGTAVVDGAVDDEAGRVDVVLGLHQRPALVIDLDQAGGRDLVEQHAVGVDQEVSVRPRHPQPPALVSKDGTILGTLVQSRRLWITGGAVCWLTGDQLARINALPRRTA